METPASSSNLALMARFFETIREAEVDLDEAPSRHCRQTHRQMAGVLTTEQCELDAGGAQPARSSPLPAAAGSMAVQNQA